MGVKPSARASKSTLIDHILREAGIETAPEEKPRRSRVSKAAAARTDDRPREGGPRPEHRPGPGGPQPFDANDPANRRGRRRRGRERGDREVVPERGGQGDAQYQGEPIPVEGLLDLREEGFGF